MTVKDVPQADLDMQTSEEHWAIEFSIEMGAPLTQLFQSMSSRDYTRYRARSFVNAALADIREEQRPKPKR